MQDAVGQFLASPTVTTAVTVIAAGVVGLWILAAWWTYQDMQRRSTSDLAAFGAVAWVLLSTPALLPLSFPIYLLGRPQQTVAQSRSRTLTDALEAELSDAVECPGCGRLADEEWRRCPSCSTWLQAECEHCGRWSNAELDICPWCAVERTPVGVRALGPTRRAAIMANRPSPGSERRAEPARRRQVPARLGW